MTRRLFVIFALICCASPGFAGSKRLKLEVPYRRPGLGIGGGRFTGIVFGIEGEQSINTCAIVQAVSAFPAGFVYIPSDGFEAKQPYRTDYGKLTSAMLTEYNERNPDLPLQVGPLYGVIFEVSFEVRKRFVLYQVKSKLYYSGRDSGQWYEYAKKYNDTFFSKKLLSGIEQQIGLCAKPK